MMLNHRIQSTNKHLAQTIHNFLKVVKNPTKYFYFNFSLYSAFILFLFGGCANNPDSGGGCDPNPRIDNTSFYDTYNKFQNYNDLVTYYLYPTERVSGFVGVGQVTSVPVSLIWPPITGALRRFPPTGWEFFPPHTIGTRMGYCKVQRVKPNNGPPLILLVPSWANNISWLMDNKDDLHIYPNNLANPKSVAQLALTKGFDVYLCEFRSHSPDTLQKSIRRNISGIRGYATQDTITKTIFPTDAGNQPKYMSFPNIQEFTRNYGTLFSKANVTNYNELTNIIAIFKNVERAPIETLKNFYLDYIPAHPYDYASISMALGLPLNPVADNLVYNAAVTHLNPDSLVFSATTNPANHSEIKVGEYGEVMNGFTEMAYTMDDLINEDLPAMLAAVTKISGKNEVYMSGVSLGSAVGTYYLGTQYYGDRIIGEIDAGTLIDPTGKQTQLKLSKNQKVKKLAAVDPMIAFQNDVSNVAATFQGALGGLSSSFKIESYKGWEGIFLAISFLLERSEFLKFFLTSIVTGNQLAPWITHSSLNYGVVYHYLYQINHQVRLNYDGKEGVEPAWRDSFGNSKNQPMSFQGYPEPFEIGHPETRGYITYLKRINTKITLWSSPGDAYSPTPLRVELFSNFIPAGNASFRYFPNSWTHAHIFEEMISGNTSDFWWNQIFDDLLQN